MTALARARHASALTDLGADEVLDHGFTTSDRISPRPGRDRGIQHVVAVSE
ncbi:hypothetical protein [Streptomyces mirabilis]|uniref:hypothetical protein n=1 Tax=Streptomyces mirabilis TaxID=68239 RepID=UPI0034374EDF